MRFFVTLLLTFYFAAAIAQLAVQGHADLSQYTIKEESRFDLSGDWEFYWNKLLTPADFEAPQHPAFIYAPGSWHRQGDYSLQGYGTYRLRLTLPENQNSLAIHFPIINASAKVWVNGELVEETGIVSADLEVYKPKLSATIVSIPDNEREVEIVIQAANYTYFSGGIAGIPMMEKSSALFSRINRANGIENFFAGSLIALCIYQLILYFLYHRGMPYLWVALICLGVALRSLITHRGSFLLPNLFPAIDWETWKKIEFGSVYSAVALFPLYIYHLFRGFAPKKPVIIFVTVAGLLLLAVIATPQYIYGQFLDVFHVSLLLAFVYAIYSIARAWKAGNEDARMILFGVLASFPFIMAEMSKNSALFSLNIQFPYLVEMGVLIFLIFQVYLLANHYAKSYRNLETLNQNLEKIVDERTGELRTANTVKNRLLSVMSHDIKSPLNSLRGILQIYNKGAITKDEFEGYAKHIENDLNKTSILVENILYWTATQLKGVKVRIEMFDLNLLIDENVQLFQTIAASKKITLSHSAPEKLMINSDKNIINLVLRNLISNAIKFSFEGGEIKVLVKPSAHSMLIQVQDQGVGMDEVTLRMLQAPELAVSSSGTGDEKGTGLGLALCREYLQKAGGQLTIESALGKGSTFNIRLTL